jgi:hypothetical protein
MSVLAVRLLTRDLNGSNHTLSYRFSILLTLSLFVFVFVLFIAFIVLRLPVSIELGKRRE